MTYLHNRTASNNGNVIANMSASRFLITDAIPANVTKARVEEVQRIAITTARRLGLTYSAAKTNIIGTAPPKEKEK